MKAMMEGNLTWGNAAVVDPKAVDELGLRGAVEEYYASSPRRSSSGKTSSIQRREGRKGRQAHYTRKAILEREKEEERRRVWERRYPGAAEANWQRREAKRKTRKTIARRIRKGRKTSSKRH